MKHLLILAVFLTLGTACSTLNPFGKDKAEDLNALTYGNDYDNGNPKNGDWASTDSNQSYGNAPTSSQSHAAREVASDDHAKKSSYYSDERLDPTDDDVRNQIESKRGITTSPSSRGERVTKSDFYDNAPGDGSLWANENDGNYFFTKGKVRSMGDIISIKLEDALVKQFAEEIKKSLTPAEQEVEMALYLKNSDAAKNDEDLKAYRNVASDDLKTSEASAVKTKMEKAVRWSQVDLSKAVGMAPNEELRAEIIDRYQNGNYKIRAVKRILYRGSSKNVSLVAVAPAADFDEKDLINSGKLYEYKIKVAR
jgi:hypothetical protein